MLAGGEFDRDPGQDRANLLFRWASEQLTPEEAQVLQNWAISFRRASELYGQLDPDIIYTLSLEEVPEASDVWMKMASIVGRQASLRSSNQNSK